MTGLDLAGLLAYKDSALYWLKTVQKTVGAAIGFLGMLASFAFVPEPYSLWVATASGVLGTISVYALPYLVGVVESLPDAEPENPEAVSATDLIAEYEAEHWNAAPEPALNELEPSTRPMDITELLDALKKDS